ncbi:hypothetical protein HYV86_03415 [Candidatus Woesearchaeota archaeon]|nr:hypothetical protein [Candidatus Woesearchaeota archaeon]
MLYELYQRPILTVGIIAFLLIWHLLWQGLALWHAARNKHTVWFILILLLNTIGILPIIYLILHREKKPTATVSTTPEVTPSKSAPKKRKQKNEPKSE